MRVAEFGPFDHLADAAHGSYIDGYAEQAVTRARRWRPLARAAGDRLTWLYLGYTEAIGLQELGRHDAARVASRALLDEVAPDEPVWRVKALSMHAEACTRSGRQHEAIDAIAEADAVSRLVRPGTYGHLSSAMAVALALRSLALFEQADERLQAIDLPADPAVQVLVVQELAQTSASWGATLVLTGDEGGAAALLATTSTRALRMARLAVDADNPVMAARAEVIAAWAQHGLGDEGVGVARARAAAGRFEHRPELLETHLLRLVLAAGARREGDRVGARALLRAAVADAQAMGRETWASLALEHLAALESDEHGTHPAVEIWRDMTRSAVARLWAEREGRFRALQDRDEVHRLTAHARDMGREVLLDPLTGLGNRRGLLEALDASASVRASALFVDVDTFKHVNDRFSHETGDEVLRRVAAILRASCRTGDTVARYGGDEFVVVSDADAATAGTMARRIRDAVTAHPWHEVATGLRITVSIGVGHASDAGAAMAAADHAVLAAKRAGRDRVLVGSVTS